VLVFVSVRVGPVSGTRDAGRVMRGREAPTAIRDPHAPPAASRTRTRARTRARWPLRSAPACGQTKGAGGGTRWAR